MMARLLAFVIAMLLPASAYAAAAPVPTGPAGFYRRLTEAINTAEGHAKLYFNSGVWETKSHAAGTVQWRIDDGTDADITFKYVNRALESAEIKFSKPVHVFLSVNEGVSFGFTQITYNASGDDIGDDRFPDNERSKHWQGSARAQRILSIATNPSDLLKGRVFANIDSVAKCDNKNSNCSATQSPLVYEVAFGRTAKTPALLVQLGPSPTAPTEVTLPLSKPSTSGRPSSYLGLGSGSTVILDDVKYFVDEHYLEGTLTHLDLQITGGQFNTGDVVMVLAPGSRLGAENFSFKHDGATGQNTIDTDHGNLQAVLGAASRFQLARASIQDPSRESFLTTRDGSTAVLRDVVFHASDGAATRISWSNNSHLDLYIETGRLNLGKGSQISLGNTDVHMNLAGAWEAGQPPSASATDVKINAQIAGGEFPINSGSTLRLGTGLLVGEHLTIDSTASPVLRGTISNLSVNILGGTTVAFPGAVTLVTTDGGHFALDPAGTGLQIGPASDFPVGRYFVIVPFRVFDNSSAKNFELRDGRATLPVESLVDGTIQNPRVPNVMPWEISGDLVLSAGSGSLTIASTITGSFHVSRTDPPSFAGTFSGRGRPGLALPIVTPSIGMRGQPPAQDDLHVYSVAATLRVPSEFVVPTTPFVIGGDGRATVSLQLTDMPFELDVSSGQGEHQTSDDPASADGTHGPDKQQHWQEVLQTKHVCTLHLYVAPRLQHGSFNATVALTPSDVSVNVTELHFDHEFSDPDDYHRDGCDPTLFTTVIGFVLGGLPGLIGGYVLGHKVNNKIDDVIRERIGAFTSGISHSWRIPFRS